MVEHLISDLILNTSKALLGEIEARFRGVAVEWQNDIINVFFYIDGEIDQDLEDNCTSIGAEIVACYVDVGIEEKIIRIDFPKKLPVHLNWVYKRKEKDL